MLILMSVSSAISSDDKSVEAVFVDTPPRINGKVNEEVWMQAGRVNEFFQREPDTGEPASEKTEVFICYDRDYLYFGFKCYENPRNIIAKELARDANLAYDDKIVIMLDTFLDRRNSFWFQVNARACMGDALHSQNGAVRNKEWDCIWKAKSSIHGEGWDTEVAIPFKSLNFHPTRDTWGLKLLREIPYRSEVAYWPVANLNAYKFQISDGGLLTGLQNITQGIGLDVRPYALSGLDQERNKQLKYPVDAGVDIFYQVTPGIKSVLTLNTDFAQTEVDDRQINLTRFKLVFPEKRDFFLDGANYFKFSREGEDESPKSSQLIPFFSRRIGLSETGEPVPILGGVKATGQAGRWNLGIFNILDYRDSGRRNFTVLRVSRNIGSQSALGFIGTMGNAVSDEKNSVIGVDVKLATSSFRGDKNLSLQLYGLKSSTSGISGKDRAFGAEINYPNDFFGLRTGYTQIEPGFFPGIGFVPRENIRNTYIMTKLGPRPKKWGILQFIFQADFDYITDMNNRLLTRELDFSPLGIRFVTGDQVTFKISQQYESIDEDFSIFRDYVIPAGTFDFQRYSITLSSAQKRHYWAIASYQWGDFWNGKQQQTTLTAGYKICVPVFAGLEVEHNVIELPVARFNADVIRFNGDILFSPVATLMSFIQYDNDSKQLGWQSRFRWIIEPGNEIVIVWNSIWKDPLERIHPSVSDFELSQSTARIKIHYNYRF